MLNSKLLLILAFVLANVSMTQVASAKSERRQTETSRFQKSPEVENESEEEDEDEDEDEKESASQARRSSRQNQAQRPERTRTNSQASSAKRECLQDVHAEAMALFQKVRTACRDAKSGAGDMAACDTARAEIETSIQSFRTKIQACMSQNQPAPQPMPQPLPMPVPAPKPPAPAPQPMPLPLPVPKPPAPAPQPMPAPMPVPKPPMPAPQPMPAPMPAPMPLPAPALDGAALYQKNCSSCHDSLANSERKGRSAAQITSALKNVSEMRNRSNLMALTPAEVSAIATALGGKP